MQSVIEGALSITLVVLMAVCASHPMTWRTELLRLEYSILKEVRRTDNWGNPSIFPYSKHKRASWTESRTLK